MIQVGNPYLIFFMIMGYSILEKSFIHFYSFFYSQKKKYVKVCVFSCRFVHLHRHNFFYHNKFNTESV